MTCPESELQVALSTGDVERARHSAEALSELLERQRLAIARLEQSSRLIDLGRLLAEVAHELRQPLVGVKGFAQAIMRAPGDVQQAERRATAIEKQATRMETIIQRALSYARGSQPQGRAHNASVASSIRAAAELLEIHSTKRDVQVELDLDETDPHCDAEAVELQQVFVNLIGNAIDASSPGGGPVRVICRSVGPLIEVVVEDDGPGIPEAVRDSLFNPFYTTKSGGTGLGLYVCRRIIDRAGGDIRVGHSQRGARFEVRLPRVEEILG